MYGKIFEDIFHSTVADYGGDTVYVFIAMIVLSDKKGYIRHSVAGLARAIGKDVGTVQTCITNLEAEDPESNDPSYDGKRIIPLSVITDGEENRGWWVVNKEKYAKIAKRQDRSDQSTARSQKYREKHNKNNDETQGDASGREKGHTDVDVYVNTDINNKPNKKFIPPTVDEVRAYCQERGNSVDPEQFVNHYKTSGWMRGKTKIKDWKACVITWEKNTPKKEDKFGGML